MRNYKIFVILILLTFSFISCNKSCDCKETWDTDITYSKDDLVSYDGQCWVAITQGKGIIPGPWLENGNDIWEECTE